MAEFDLAARISMFGGPALVVYEGGRVRAMLVRLGVKDGRRNDHARSASTGSARGPYTRRSRRGGRIDLAGFAYGALETRSFVEAASHTGGTLTVVDGAETASFTFLGGYSNANFMLSDDAHHGTYVTYV